MIQTRHYPDLDLIVHTVTGKLGIDDALAMGAFMYGMDPVPMWSLWDMTDAIMEDFSYKTTRGFQDRAALDVRGREGGKTALVAPGDFNFGVARQYTIMAESLDLPFEHRVFRSLEEAFSWLGIDRLDESEGVTISR